MTSFSDVWIRSLPPPEKGQKAYWDEKLPSFGVRVSQGGSKTFVVNRRNNLITLGRFGVLTLSEARTEARKLLAEFTLGKVRPTAITYDKAVELFITEKEKSRRPRTASEYKKLLNRFSFGPLPVPHTEVARQLAKIKKHQQYNHALTALKTLFNWCENNRYIDDNPCRGLSPYKTASRTRVLSDEELAKIWRACEPVNTQKHSLSSDERQRHLPASFCTIVKLLILTGMRRTECASLKRNYYSHNQQTLCLPSEVTKNGRELTLPVSALTAAILGPLLVSSLNSPVGLLFPRRGHIDATTAFSGWSKAKSQLDKASGVSGWTLHTIRHTFRTIHARIGTMPHIAERLVNHISSRSDVEQIYDHWQYLESMRDAMQHYETTLRGILDLNAP